MTDATLEDLEELVSCKGWAWLCDQRDKDWGAEAFAEKVEGIAKSAPDAFTQQSQMNQVIVAKREVCSFMARPQQEINRRRAELQRRPDDLAGQRRRGETL